MCANRNGTHKNGTKLDILEGTISIRHRTVRPGKKLVNNEPLCR